MKIRAQQCLTFPSCPMFGKGGGSSHAQQVSTHCRRARALITALSPRSYPKSHPHSLPGNNAPGEIYVASPQAGLPSSFKCANISLIYGASVQEDSQLTC